MKLFGKGVIVSAALFGASLTGIDAASAMPIAPDGVAAPSAPIETVRWPCGPYRHPNPWGVCVVNSPYGPGPGYGIYRPYGGYRPYWGHRRWGYGGGYYR